MLKIGVNTNNSTLITELNQIIDSSKIEFISLENQTITSSMDGLVIEIDSIEMLSQKIDVLLVAKETKKLWTWIYGPEDVLEFRQLFLKLGANGIINAQNGAVELGMIIFNLFSMMPHSIEKEDMTITLDEKSLSMVIGNRYVNLTSKEYVCVAYLLENKNRIIPYDEIFARIWGENNPYSKYRLANLVCLIRKKLNDYPKLSLKNIREKGYLLEIKG